MGILSKICENSQNLSKTIIHVQITRNSTFLLWLNGRFYISLNLCSVGMVHFSKLRKSFFRSFSYKPFFMYKNVTETVENHLQWWWENILIVWQHQGWCVTVKVVKPFCCPSPSIVSLDVSSGIVIVIYLSWIE